MRTLSFLFWIKGYKCTLPYEWVNINPHKAAVIFNWLPHRFSPKYFFYCIIHHFKNKFVCFHSVLATIKKTFRINDHFKRKIFIINLQIKFKIIIVITIIIIPKALIPLYAFAIPLFCPIFWVLLKKQIVLPTIIVWITPLLGLYSHKKHSEKMWGLQVQ